MPLNLNAKHMDTSRVSRHFEKGRSIVTRNCHRFFRRLFKALACVPACFAIGLWWRSISTYDRFAHELEIATWPDGRRTTVPSLNRLILDNVRPIYKYRIGRLESCAGELKLTWFSELDDLSYPMALRIFAMEHMDSIHIPQAPGIVHSSSRGHYRPYFKLDAPANGGWSKFSLTSTGDFKIQHHSETSFQAVIPYWWLVILTSLPAAFITVPGLRRFYRRKRGRCSRCGYDLRATPDRCPECGTETSTVVHFCPAENAERNAGHSDYQRGQ
jgi:hypothetical protein